MKCNNCGQTLPEDSVFCHYCGARLASAPMPMDEVITSPFEKDDAFNIVEKLMATHAIESAIAAEANKGVHNQHVGDPNFGLVPEKPIYTKGINEQEKYLKRLRTIDGRSITWERRGCISAKGVNGLIDIYDISLASGEYYQTIYINMYGADNSTAVPKGFSANEQAKQIPAHTPPVAQAAVRKKPKAHVQIATTNTAPLLKRAFMFLEDGDWKSADKYCERVLDLDPECAEAYLGKLMAELRVNKQENLKDCAKPFDGKDNYQKVIRFADSALKNDLVSYINHINTRNKKAHQAEKYEAAVDIMNSARTEARFKTAAETFEKIRTYKDAEQLAQECYEKAEVARKDSILSIAELEIKRDTRKDYERALQRLNAISGWNNADELAERCQDGLAKIEEREELARKKAAQKAKRKKILALIGIPVTIAVIALILLKMPDIRPAIQYRKAIALMDAENRDKAHSIFQELGDYKDAAEKADNIRLIKVKEQLKNASVGDYVFFGEYEQDNNHSNGKEKIEWLVLDVQDNNVLLISKYALDCQFFHYSKNAHVVWESCNLRRWLNNYFFDSAFTDSDKAIIPPSMDQVFLLSIDEANDYFKDNSSRKCIPTDYAVSQGVYLNNNEITCTWWLRSEGFSSYRWDAAASVKSTGFISSTGNFSDSDGVAVRPAMWVDISMDGYIDSVDKIEEYTVAIFDEDYNEAVALMESGQYVDAAFAFGSIAGYKDAREQSFALWEEIAVHNTIGAGDSHTVALKTDGTVVATGVWDHNRCNVRDWSDIVAISAGSAHTVGLKADGTVVAVGWNNVGQRNVESWSDVVAISAGGSHTVGLKADGTVVAVGSNALGQCNVNYWTDIIAVSAGGYYTVGLKADGTVVAVGSNSAGQCNVGNWTDIIAISAGGSHTVGLKADGTVVAAGDNSNGQCNVNNWTDIIAISAGADTVGLKSNGTAVAVGFDNFGETNLEKWSDIIAISSGEYHTVGLKEDGTVVALGWNKGGQTNTGSWTKIRTP